MEFSAVYSFVDNPLSVMIRQKMISPIFLCRSYGPFRNISKYYLFKSGQSLTDTIQVKIRVYIVLYSYTS